MSSGEVDDLNEDSNLSTGKRMQATNSIYQVVYLFTILLAVFVGSWLENAPPEAIIVYSASNPCDESQLNNQCDKSHVDILERKDDWFHVNGPVKLRLSPQASYDSDGEELYYIWNIKFASEAGGDNLEGHRCDNIEKDSICIKKIPLELPYIKSIISKYLGRSSVDYW